MFIPIQQELAKLEQQQQINILYAVESGSRAWGFASQNSDWDVRFIYVHPPDWYLRLEDRNDCIEQMLPDDIDLSGWELQKALRLFRKSNPSLLEWLHSPIVYQLNEPFLEIMRTATASYFNPKNCLYGYLNMARRNWEAYFTGEQVRLKKYLYVLRPILACMWIERTASQVPMEFDILLENEIREPVLRQAIDALLLRKKSGDELDVGPRIALLDHFLKERMTYYDTLLKTYPSGNVPGWNDLNKIFQHILHQTWNKTEHLHHIVEM